MVNKNKRKKKTLLKRKALLFLFLFSFLSFFFVSSPKKASSSLNTDYVELGVSTDAPTVNNVSFNAGSDFTPAENTTKDVDITGKIIDNDGCSDVESVTGLTYRSGVSSTCAADDNNCYRDVTCSTSCSGTVVSATCAASLWFHVDPTDTSSEWWEAAIAATDVAGETGFGDSSGSTDVDVATLRALYAPTSLSYNVSPGGDTGSENATTEIQATGNTAVDCSIKGTDLSLSSYSIGVTNQHYGLSSFTFDGGSESTLTGSDVAFDLALIKPTAHEPSDQTDIIYWGIKAPSGSPIGDYTGTNTITATQGKDLLVFENCGDSFHYENTVYDTVTIGSQCWLADNLNVGTRIDGTSEQGTSCSNIDKYCYDDLTSNCNTYGGLYQWDQATCATSSTLEPSGVQGICPSGWHIPSHHEFTTLERTVCSDIGNSSCDVTFPKDYSTTGYLGQDTTTAEGEGSALAGNEPLWTDDDIDNSGAGNNDFGTSGFNALPAGNRGTDGSFLDEGYYATFWSASESGGTAWRRGLYFTNTNIYRGEADVDVGRSVRCLRD